MAAPFYQYQALSKGLASLCRLQPVKETRQKQIGLWTELILKYCKHHKVWLLSKLSPVSPVAPCTVLQSATGFANLLLLSVLTDAASQDFILSTDAAEDHPLFVNKAIDSAPARRVTVCALVLLHFIAFAVTESVCSAPGRLNREARVYILNELVQQGVALVLL